MSLENIVSGYPSIIFIYFKLIALFNKLRKTFFLLVKEIKFVKSHFLISKRERERKREKEREREREKKRNFCFIYTRCN